MVEKHRDVEGPCEEVIQGCTCGAQRQAEGAANATINRECAALKRMFSLAVKGEKIPRAPHIGMLQEHNVRTGFFEDHQYEALRAHLPAYARAVVTFAYITG